MFLSDNLLQSSPEEIPPGDLAASRISQMRPSRILVLEHRITHTPKYINTPAMVCTQKDFPPGKLTSATKISQNNLFGWQNPILMAVTGKPFVSITHLDDHKCNSAEEGTVPLRHTGEGGGRFFLLQQQTMDFLWISDLDKSVGL